MHISVWIIHNFHAQHFRRNSGKYLVIMSNMAYIETELSPLPLSSVFMLAIALVCLTFERAVQSAYLPIGWPIDAVTLNEPTRRLTLKSQLKIEHS